MSDSGRGRGTALLAAMLAGSGSLAGCASIPEAPAPLAVELPSPVPERGAFRFPSVEPYPLLVEPAGPPLPLLPVPVEWWPGRPLQAGAVAFRVRQPAGPPLRAVELRLGGRALTVHPTAEGWLALGGLPLDSAGPFELEIAYRRRGEPESRTLLVPVRERTYPSTRIGISAGGPSDPEVEARIARERALIRRTLETSTARWWPTGGFRWPRPPVRTSPFGQRRVFNGSVRSRHLGLDLRAYHGHPIFAPATGRVALTGSFFYQGNAVYIDHGLGLVTAYFHMSRLEVEEGDVVAPGQILGRSGSTGRSTAAHLHWSAYVNGATVDPESLIGLELPFAAADDAVERN